MARCSASLEGDHLEGARTRAYRTFVSHILQESHHHCLPTGGVFMATKGSIFSARPRLFRRQMQHRAVRVCDIVRAVSLERRRRARGDVCAGRGLLLTSPFVSADENRQLFFYTRGSI